MFLKCFNDLLGYLAGTRLPAEVGGAKRSLGQHLCDGSHDGFARFSIPEVLEHHAPDQIWPIGFATSLPAMPGAEPCTGSNMDGNPPSGLRLAEGAIPMLPAIAAPRSLRMSPKRLEATTTSKWRGSSTNAAAKASM